MDGILTGKGIYLWKVRDILGGNAEKIANRAKELGFDWVAIKVQNGVLPYNMNPVTSGDMYVPPLVDALRSVGVIPVGWGYTFGENPVGEAERISERVKKFNFETFIIDAEEEYKVPTINKRAGVFMKWLRHLLPDTELILSSYRYPNYHPEFPWKEFMTMVDGYIPQVYWAKANNPDVQLRRSIGEYRSMEQRYGLKEKPIIPAGAAYKEHGWMPTEGEIALFQETVRALGLPGVTYWDWYHMEILGFGKVIGDFRLETTPEEPIKSVELPEWARGIDAFLREKYGYAGPQLSA